MYTKFTSNTLMLDCNNRCLHLQFYFCKHIENVHDNLVLGQLGLDPKTHYCRRACSVYYIRFIMLTKSLLRRL